MPRPLPPNAEALRAQAAAPAPATEPEANPVELAFELAGEISDSLQTIALALSGLFTIEAARARAEIGEAPTVAEGQTLEALRSISLQLAQAMEADQEPTGATGTDTA